MLVCITNVSEESYICALCLNIAWCLLLSWRISNWICRSLTWENEFGVFFASDLTLFSVGLLMPCQNWVTQSSATYLGGKL